MSVRVRIADPFPEPPGSIVRAWELLKVVRRGDADEMASYRVSLDDLPRPWLPATCPRYLRENVWNWCDAVAEWVNRQYTWRPTQMIPPCWPRHPHVANELPVLAFTRWLAEDNLGPDALDNWHRVDFPDFLERMTSRLGESTCRSGKHQDWPAGGRFATFLDHASDRADLIFADTHPAPELPSKAHSGQR